MKRLLRKTGGGKCGICLARVASQESLGLSENIYILYIKKLRVEEATGLVNHRNIYNAELGQTGTRVQVELLTHQ